MRKSWLLGGRVYGPEHDHTFIGDDSTSACADCDKCRSPVAESEEHKWVRKPQHSERTGRMYLAF